jgi:predicted translation initiation factor SUI1
VLFLCTGNYYRSRFAEVLFNHLAAKMGAPWEASSRALALERGSRNIGPMAGTALAALKTLGVAAPEACARLPQQACADDFTHAHLVVALKQIEHLPLLQERFPPWAEKVEYWHIDDAPEALALLEREVMDLLARLLGGRKSSADAAPEPPAPSPPPRLLATVRVGRETKGRRGKGVTTVSDVPLDAAALRELTARLKQLCGTGGTLKEGRIEIQGDHRDRLVTELERLGYKVKRAGG